jgi:hypothetical protein
VWTDLTKIKAQASEMKAAKFCAVFSQRKAMRLKMAAAGLWTTADDLARIGCEFLRILKRILLTLAMRPIHAFLFGRAADRWGRRPTLMVDVLLYSFIEFASCFSPNLTVLLVLRRSETTTVSH